MEKSRRRQAEIAQPQAQHRVAQRVGKVKPFAPAQRRGTVAAQPFQFEMRLGIDMIGGRARPRRAVRKRDGGIRPALRQPRQDFVAQKIAAQSRVGVARVVDP